MKKFYELTKEKQVVAIQYAERKVHELINHGVVVSDRQPTQADVREMATCMAEDAFYSERTDTIVADIADGK
jgi:hypothetical protein